MTVGTPLDAEHVASRLPAWWWPVRPGALAVGAVGGILVITAAWLRTARPAVVVGLVAAGVVPFAVLGWTALVPVLIAALAGGLTVPLVRS